MFLNSAYSVSLDYILPSLIDHILFCVDDKCFKGYLEYGYNEVLWIKVETKNPKNLINIRF